MARNYYVVLGVPPDADGDAIRSAFRRLARRYHPDRGGGEDSGSFREVAEAYDVLSDPDRRARYDRRFGEPGPPVEPLISSSVPITGRPESVRPSLEALLDRIASNFAGIGAPKAERAQPLHFELVLSREEAARGVRIPFRVPVFAICAACGGSGRDWLFSCRTCQGEGRTAETEEIRVFVPRGVSDRECFDVSLERLGVRNLWLRLHVRVAAS